MQRKLNTAQAATGIAFYITLSIVLFILSISLISVHAQAKSLTQNQLPQVNYLGSGPNTFTIDSSHYFWVKSGESVFSRVAGGTYQADTGERVWETDYVPDDAYYVHGGEAALGVASAGCVVEYVQLDDDPDSRRGRFLINNTQVHEPDQGMVVYGRFEIADGGDLTFNTEDSVALVVVITCTTPTPTNTPTYTPTPTATPTTVPPSYDPIFVLDSGFISPESNFIGLRTPPQIDGELFFGEWDLSKQHAFENGFIVAHNDGLRLYILLDILADTGEDSADAALDAYTLTFDVDKNTAISPNVDLQYTLDNTNLRYRYYEGPDRWGDIQTETLSSRGHGFGCFIADDSLQVRPEYVCNEHRVYELAIDLSEIKALPGDSVRMGLQTRSQTPALNESIPTGFTTDFSRLIQINLASAWLLTTDQNATLSFDSDAIEVTQAIQDRQNSLPLVANKRTVARVYARTSGVSEAQPAAVYLYASVLGVDLPGSPLAQLHYAPSESIDRADVFDTANFQLPASWANGSGAIDFVSTIRTLSDESTTTVKSSQYHITFSEREVPVIWTIPINTGTDDEQNIASIVGMRNQESFFVSVFPIANARFVRRNWQEIGALGNKLTGLQWPEFERTVLNELIQYYNHNIAAWSASVTPYLLPNHLYGYLPWENGGISDPLWVNGEGIVATGGIWTDDIMAHEINHNLDRTSREESTWGRHVGDTDSTTWDYPGNEDFIASNPEWGCGASGPDTHWEDVMGDTDYIGEIGFDTRLDLNATFAPIPDNMPDIMSYCRAPGRGLSLYPDKWVSTYRWNYLFANNFPNPVGLQVESAALEKHNLVEPVNYITVQVSRDGNGYIAPIFTQPGLAMAQGTEGDYSLEIQDTNGGILYVHRFPIVFINSEGEPVDQVSITLRLPAQQEAFHFLLKHNEEVLAERSASPTKPIIEVLEPNGGETWSGEETIRWQATDADGDELRFDIYYSPDNGDQWFPIAWDLTENSYIVNTEILPSGVGGRIRIVVTDGFHTVEDESDAPFTVSPRAPQVTIIQPFDGQEFATGTMIEFVGSAIGSDESELSGASLIWTYDDTVFGQGGTANAALPEGTYTIVLTAMDADSNEGTASITIKITDAPNQLPIAVDDTGTTEQGMPITIPVLENDSDPDGDTLSIEAVTAPANGQAVIEDSSIRYTPSSDFVGEERFTYTATDSKGGQDQATIAITVIRGSDSQNPVYLPIIEAP
ncbi:MAG: Ig-like domain-containing protein [Caldilineaceae bacterium]|nr:Ig-like domain-containing protein [Caldilineaceae bacterium]